MTDGEGRATEYTTVDGEHLHELEVKRSRFLAYLRRTEDEEQARAFVAELRRAHHDARHHCSAFVLGPDRRVQRSNDDGEPSGTAGAPMLEALLKRETAEDEAALSDVTAVVVRYFGGVLLGAGGLVRAYSAAVSSALDTAPLLRRRRMRLFGIDAPHAAAGRLENELRAAGVQVLGTDYAPAAARLRVALPDAAGAGGDFDARLAALTAGTTRADGLGTAWVDLA
ncbi:IMPACT family protein [Zafaria sp. Z1313]|uniref:IMPACT family protein n=1 Tax=unclassified Zafaria TaxID=2828765 RepID=UPI002E768B7D|nr:YigZ family protein [Zafaria sp. J156]MEE1620176.1 YigZ family protein [Zafaria sp. J156]